MKRVEYNILYGLSIRVLLLSLSLFVVLLEVIVQMFEAYIELESEIVQK